MKTVLFVWILTRYLSFNVSIIIISNVLRSGRKDRMSAQFVEKP